MFHGPRAAFTLIELMMVIVVIALLATIVATNMDNMTVARRLRADVRKVGSTVEWARAGAISKGMEQKIVYDLDEQEYWILSPEKRAEEYEEGEKIELEILGEKLQISEGVQIVSVQAEGGEKVTSGETEITFSPMGFDGSHIVILAQADDSGDELSIRFNGVLGTASVTREEAEFRELGDE